jgi:hypothetical protein
VRKRLSLVASLCRISAEFLASSIQVTRVEKKINAPLKFVYDWCTDYQETDHEITGSIRRRSVVERTSRRVIYVYYWNDEAGKLQMAVNIVALKPPSSWHLDFFGKEQTETGEYKLTRISKNETKLQMVFKHKWKEGQKIPSVAEQEERLGKMWDKYVTALESDYGKK